MARAFVFLAALALAAAGGFYSGSYSAEQRLRDEMSTLVRAADSQREAALAAREKLDGANRELAALKTNFSSLQTSSGVNDEGEFQRLREALIAAMVNDGFLVNHKAIADNVVVAQITSAYLALERSSQTLLMSVVYMYYFHDKGDGASVLLENATTSQRVGWYSDKGGLVLE